MSENNLHNLPLPVAQVLQRIENAKDAGHRHGTTYDLFEVILKLSSVVRHGTYLNLGCGSVRIDDSLKDLLLPSTGFWLHLLKDLSDFFAPLSIQEYEAAARSATALLQRQCDLPACSEWVRVAASAIRERETVASELTFFDVAEVFVQ